MRCSESGATHSAWLLKLSSDPSLLLPAVSKDDRSFYLPWTNTKARFPASSFFFFFSMGMKAGVWRDADYFQLFCWHVRMGPSWSAVDIHCHWSLKPALGSQAMSSPWVRAPQTWGGKSRSWAWGSVFCTYVCLSSLCRVSNLCKHE